MGCCGKSRARNSVQPAPAPKPVSSSGSSFQYIGASKLTVRGPVSRQRYRFAAPGAIVAVDDRDASALERVPLLRRV